MIFSFVYHSENSMIASTRIATYLSNFLQMPVVDHRTIDEWKGKKIPVLYIVNGAYGFCKCLPELAALVKDAGRIVWVQNDYSIIPPKIDSKGISPFRAAFRERHDAGKPDMIFWSTCEEWSSKKGSSYVNWNMLTFDPAYSPKKIAKRRSSSTDTLLYYGSYRDGSGKSSRVPLFDRYFREPHVHTVISSPGRSGEPHEDFVGRYVNDRIVHMGPIKEDFYEFLGKQGLGLYIEDRKSSENFHSPANRFYEMLSAGLPMVFQQECGPMLRRAGYDPTPYVAEKAKDVVKFMAKRETLGQEQRDKWIGDRDYQHELLVQVTAAHKGLKL